MALSLRLSEEDDKLIRDYANFKSMSVSEVVRLAVIEKIEDEFDLDAYNKAFKDYKENPVTYSHDEVKRELGL